MSQQKLLAIANQLDVRFLELKTTRLPTKVVVIFYDLSTEEVITCTFTRINRHCKIWQMQKSKGCRDTSAGHTLDAVDTFGLAVASKLGMTACTYMGMNLETAMKEKEVRTTANIFVLPEDVLPALADRFAARPMKWTVDANDKASISFLSDGDDTSDWLRIVEVPKEGLMHLLASVGVPGFKTGITDISNPRHVLDKNVDLGTVNVEAVGRPRPKSNNILFIKTISPGKFTILGLAQTVKGRQVAEVDAADGAFKA